MRPWRLFKKKCGGAISKMGKTSVNFLCPPMGMTISTVERKKIEDDVNNSKGQQEGHFGHLVEFLSKIARN